MTAKQPKLTRKQQVFVEEYAKTGNGTQSALAAYDVNNPDTAKSIASENLTKPYIQSAIASLLPENVDELITEAHRSLLTAVRLDYFVFPRSMGDEEIVEHVEANGLMCVNIRPSDKGKLAFFSLPDGPARGKALELAYKLKGVLDKGEGGGKHLHIHMAPNDKVRDLAKKLNGIA